MAKSKKVSPAIEQTIKAACTEGIPETIRNVINGNLRSEISELDQSLARLYNAYTDYIELRDRRDLLIRSINELAKVPVIKVEEPAKPQKLVEHKGDPDVTGEGEQSVITAEHAIIADIEAGGGTATVVISAVKGSKGKSG
jgi:flagellar hook-associated protein FlgK